MAMIAIHALEQKSKSRYLLFLKKNSAENIQNVCKIGNYIVTRDHFNTSVTILV
jgi:hypothetical protein